MRLGEFRFQTEQTNQTPIGKVILVGMMEDGPTGRGFTFHKPSHLTRLLGDNDVTRAYQFLLDNGLTPEQIILYRLNGRAAEAIIETNEPIVRLRTLNNNEKENNVSVRLNPDGLTLYANYEEADQVQGLRKNFSRTYAFTDYSEKDGETETIDVGQLTDAITNDAMIGVHNVIAQPLSDSVRKNDIADYLNEQNMSSILTPFIHGETEQHLCAIDADMEGRDLSTYVERFTYYVSGLEFDGESTTNIISPQAEVMYFADFPVEEDPRVAKMAAVVANQKTNNQHLLCSALFRPSPVPSPQVLEEGEYMVGPESYYSTLTGQVELWEPYAEQNAFVSKLNNLFEKEDRTMPFMQHLQIIVGDDQRDDRVIPAACHYVLELMTKSNFELGANQSLTDFLTLKAKLDKEVIAKLSSNGYICTVPSVRRHVVLSKLTHFYHPEGARFIPYPHLRTLSYIQHDLHRELDPYIGGHMSAFRVGEVEDVIREYLDVYVEEEILSDYAIQVTNAASVNDYPTVDIQLGFYGIIGTISGTLTLDEERGRGQWQTLSD